jgi:hypothetical protein
VQQQARGRFEAGPEEGAKDEWNSSSAVSKAIEFNAYKQYED